MEKPFILIHLYFLWQLLLGAGLGWLMEEEEEDVPGISGTEVQKVQGFGKCGSPVRV